MHGSSTQKLSTDWQLNHSGFVYQSVYPENTTRVLRVVYYLLVVRRCLDRVLPMLWDNSGRPWSRSPMSLSSEHTISYAFLVVAIQLEIRSPMRSFIAFILCFHPRMVYVILQHGMTFKMGMWHVASPVTTRPYRKYDNPAESTIMVVFPEYSTRMIIGNKYTLT